MKENKYGCRKNDDVCLIHSCPLLGFDFCEESEIMKDFLSTANAQAIAEERECDILVSWDIVGVNEKWVVQF